MNPGRFRSLAMSAVLVLSLPAAFAQNTDPGPKQDMKDAGSDTKKDRHQGEAEGQGDGAAPVAR